jgi:3-hydroxybutyryl-CoA dehydrogenase
MIDKVGVIGSGLMGSEIALVFALAGKQVKLSDNNPEALQRALDSLGKVLGKGVQRGFYKPDETAAGLARIKATALLGPLEDCDLVIEAVFESEAVKAQVYKNLGEICQPDCIITSNTSSIPISTLASYLGPSRRANFVGTHFFSPVSRMKLVEVIPGLDTAESTVEVVMDACREVGKTPIRVKDVVGFAVNRILHAFIIEAVRLVEEGVATPEDIDIACKLGLGHPIGPFELLDATQNSLALQVQSILQDAYGDRFQPRPLLKQMVKAGYNGKRAGRGWYKYGKGAT